ncbi:MAG: hypothetical protein ACD_28C00108G0009 [uncultured bacterium]|nr:MAG: hypothetical protein ACD_28C00108G0009 [uncultured bacterium]
MKEIDLKKLHTNQRLLVEELKKRGCETSILDDDIELLEVTYGQHHEFLLDRFTSKVPHTLTAITRDKYMAKYLLRRAGLQVPEGKLFDGDQIDAGITFAQELGFPVVIKPNWGSHGDDVYSGIESEDELNYAIKQMFLTRGEATPFFIEKYFEGKEYRIFITGKGDFAAVHRDPAHVIGDGIQTIAELIQAENERRMNPRTTCLCPIAFDEIAKQYLQKNGYSENFIPQPSEKIYLRLTSNVAKGATCEDATDKLHPSVIELAQKALHVFKGLPYAGVDFLTTDITRSQEKNTYRILEINPNPGFAMHMKPGNGTPRNVASFVADLYFPETHQSLRSSIVE